MDKPLDLELFVVMLTEYSWPCFVIYIFGHDIIWQGLYRLCKISLHSHSAEDAQIQRVKYIQKENLRLSLPKLLVGEGSWGY